MSFLIMVKELFEDIILAMTVFCIVGSCLILSLVTFFILNNAAAGI